MIKLALLQILNCSSSENTIWCENQIENNVYLLILYKRNHEKMRLTSLIGRWLLHGTSNHWGMHVMTLTILLSSHMKYLTDANNYGSLGQ